MKVYTCRPWYNVKEQERSNRLRLLVSYTDDIPRGFYQFGPMPGDKLECMLFGSITEIADEYILNGLIDHMKCNGVVGDFYFVVNTQDFNYVLGKE